ncbi:MAG: hypothetical protein IH946_06405 [Bacteroidetes bacterium]|nr:hypothetical protein [Bacteroidota bacterium]
MEMHDKTLNPEQSLKIIDDMIKATKAGISKKSFYFLMWGWLLFFAGISEYLLRYVYQSQYHWVGWMVIGVVGGIISSIYGARSNKDVHSVSFIDKFFHYLWMGFGITLVLILVGLVLNRVDPGPAIMLVTGYATFVSGMTIKFKPLIYGGILFWLFGIMAFTLLPQYSSLIFSLAIMGGYVIPGHLLNTQEKKSYV